MVIIFMFSARTADESTQDSNKLGMTIGRIVVADFEGLSEEEQLAFAEKIDYPV